VETAYSQRKMQEWSRKKEKDPRKKAIGTVGGLFAFGGDCYAVGQSPKGEYYSQKKE